MIKITTTCLNGNSNEWHSQPTANGTAIGNLLIPAAILSTGNTFQHMGDFAKYFIVQFVSAFHYYSIQNSHLFLVVHHTWKAEKGKLIQQLQQLASVDLCGDGRSDSPGHCAKYGTYTMMDETSSRIVEFNIVQVTEVSPSNAMENEGCKRTLNSLFSTNVPIRCLTTDRHSTITARMKSEYSQIKHQYVWHLSRCVTKKLSKKAKKRDCVKLMRRVQSFSNHLWWSVSTCNGDAAMLVEKWISILHHIVT